MKAQPEESAGSARRGKRKIRRKIRRIRCNRWISERSRVGPRVWREGLERGCEGAR